MKQSSANITYVHQDHPGSSTGQALSGTSLMSDTSGNSAGSIVYGAFGSTRSGSVPTDIKFTGQRLDGTGLYYYGARYYDAGIGRFISPDSIVQNFANPQSLNRYSYVFNNPLKYLDPTGMIVEFGYTYEYLWATEEAGMPVSYEAYALLLA
ncbi:MAG: RHS repeat-associated core domain-containing protein [Chloroflexi bacterium]|nr:RHS repeat-associated core domain-containing protein [Chloroflexota bacterium]